MPIIAPYESQSGIAVGNAQAGSYVSQNAFVTPGQAAMPGALQQLAGGVDKLNDALFQADLKKRQEQMELTLLQQVQGFQTNMRQQDDDYRQQNQGQNAVNAEADAQARYDQGISQMMDQWKGNRMAELYIQRHAGALALSGVNSMRDYAAKQQEAWKDSTLAGEKALYIQTITDPSKTPEERNDAKRRFDTTYTNYLIGKGLDPTSAHAQVQQIYDQGMADYAINRVTGLTQDGDTQEARRVLDGKPASVNLPPDMAALAEAAAQKHGVDPELVKAVMYTESRGKADAVSSKGARGLMQLMPDTAKELGVDPEDSTQNVDGGTRYLKQMLQKYDGNVRKALTAYNWGTGNVDAFMQTGKGKSGQDMPSETTRYADKVLGDNDQDVSRYLSARQKMALGNMIDAQVSKQKIDSAYSTLAPLPYGRALEMIASPDGQRQLGVTAQQAGTVEGMLHTFNEHKRQAEKETRDSYEKDLMTKAVNMALGVGGGQADPVAAYKMVQNDPNLDGKTRLETLKALADGTMGKNDDAGFLQNITSRIAAQDPNDVVDDGEIYKAVGAGRITFETKEKLLKFKEEAAGPQGILIKNAYKALDSAFAKSMMAEGTPEQATAHFAAQSELMSAIEDAKKKGNVQELLDPNSSKFILPGIMVRNQLTMQDQIKAMTNKMKADRQEQAQAPSQIRNKNVQDGTKADTAAFGAPKLMPGESVAQYAARAKELKKQWQEKQVAP